MSPSVVDVLALFGDGSARNCRAAPRRGPSDASTARPSLQRRPGYFRGPAETRLNQFERVLLSVKVDKSVKSQFEKSVHNHDVEAVIWVVLVDPPFEIRFDLGDLCVLAFYEFGPHPRKLGVFIFFGCHCPPGL
jgi:hypothetical protein